MNNNYLVSILVPVYNVEKYIERCVRSLLDQTYENIEYVFIDDCGNDNSINILKKTCADYSYRRKSIKIISHERNRGLAAARNMAVMNAHGEFIIHVDSDDYIERNTVELCVNKQIETNADLVSFGCFREYPNKVILQLPINFSSPKELCLALIEKKINVGIWGRLIRRDLYVQHDIRVKEGANMAEDYQVVPKLAYFSQSVSVLERPLYHYNLNNITSYVNSVSELKIRQALDSFNITYCFFIDKDKDYRNAIERAYQYTIYRQMMNCIKSGHLEELFYDLYRKTQFSFKIKYSQKCIKYSILFTIKNYELLSRIIKLF